MTAKLDIKVNTQISYNKNGYRVERVATVSNVVGSIESLLLNAINDGELPNFSDPHPSIPEIALNNITATPLGGGKYRITMSYYNDPGSAVGQSNASVSVESLTSADQTDTDINGNRLQFYTNVSTGLPNIFSSAAYTAEVQRVKTNLIFKYTSDTLPYAEITKYNGMVNSAPWNGYPAKTMLCLADAEQSGSQYSVRFSFTHNPATWKFLAAIKEPNMILPATDHEIYPDPLVDKYSASKYFHVYEYVDFNALGFDLGIEYAEISGTAVSHPRITELDIVAGGKTLLITLYGGETWVAAGATFDAQRASIIAGLSSNRSEANGWAAEIALGRILTVSSVVRTSDTVVTITFSADNLYDITTAENISVVIPAAALVNSTVEMPTITKFFTITGS